MLPRRALLRRLGLANGLQSGVAASESTPTMGSWGAVALAPLGRGHARSIAARGGEDAVTDSPEVDRDAQRAPEPGRLKAGEVDARDGHQGAASRAMTPRQDSRGGPPQAASTGWRTRRYAIKASGSKRTWVVPSLVKGSSGGSARLRWE